MEMILCWVVFPLVLAALGAGWGALVERASGARLGALLIPVGLAAALIVAGLFTTFSGTAKFAVPVTGAGALIGLVVARRSLPLERWPLIAALGVLLVYGAPVILSGSATFLGYIRLDDTATWLNIVDHVMSHARSVSGEYPSTYTLNYTGDVGNTYPLGAFMLIGVGHGLTGIDAAWILQPYMACCGAAIALCAYTLLKPLVSSPRICALAAFVAAQPALLYGYSLWGGDKEMAAAFLVILGATLLCQAIVKRPDDPRRLLPLAVAAAALIQTLGVGASAYIVPPLLVLIVVWGRRAGRRGLGRLARDLGLMAAATVALSLPVWITLSEFLSGRFGGFFTSGNTTAEGKLGNLYQSLSGWQLAGIWPIGDFRLRAPTVPSVLFITFAIIAALAAIWITIRRRQFTIVTYVAIALVAAAIYYLVGSTPWIVGKSLAISSPAILTAAVAAGVLLWLRARWAGIIVVIVIGGGVIWSNYLGYHDATLAPRGPLAELQHIGGMLSGKGPTFVNEYEVYADRHFLRAGAPTEPAEYRPYTLALNDGVYLTKEAFADLDSFPLATLEGFRSIVTSRAPVQSRPPSNYNLVWQGRYYQLWQRPEVPQTRILEHIPLGESDRLPYCGVAENGPSRSPCSIDPVAVPECKYVESIARTAASDHAELVAYQRPEPVAVRGDETLWPAEWFHEAGSRSLTALVPGTAVAHIAVDSSQRYELWLGGSFARGFEVSVDGHHLTTLKDELGNIGAFSPAGQLFLDAGVHTFEFTYPSPNLTPGSGSNEFTSLTAIVLNPTERPTSELVTVPPDQATALCGRPLDWIEIVVPNS